jgi:hypothetical protein
MNTIKVRVYVAGVLVGEEEVVGPLSTKGAKPGKQPVGGAKRG